MTELKQGKLYKCPNFYLMVYPTKEKAREASEKEREPIDSSPETRIAVGVTSGSSSPVAQYWASYWSRELGCHVRYSELGDIFMLLEEHEKVRTIAFGEIVLDLHVLFGDKQGWIILGYGAVLFRANELNSL